MKIKLLLLFCLSHLACISASKKEFFTAKSSLFDDDDESDNESDDNVDQKLRLKIWKKQNNAYNSSNCISIEYLVKALKLMKATDNLKDEEWEELAGTIIKTSSQTKKEKLKKIVQKVSFVLHMQSERDWLLKFGHYEGIDFYEKIDSDERIDFYEKIDSDEGIDSYEEIDSDEGIDSYSFLKETVKESWKKLSTDNENLVSRYVEENHPRCNLLGILLIIAAYYSVFSNFEL